MDVGHCKQVVDHMPHQKNLMGLVINRHLKALLCDHLSFGLCNFGLVKLQIQPSATLAQSCMSSIWDCYLIIFALVLVKFFSKELMGL